MAGLFAVLTLGATLAAAPVSAYAEESPVLTAVVAEQAAEAPQVGGATEASAGESAEAPAGENAEAPLEPAAETTTEVPDSAKPATDAPAAAGAAGEADDAPTTDDGAATDTNAATDDASATEDATTDNGSTTEGTVSDGATDSNGSASAGNVTDADGDATTSDSASDDATAGDAAKAGTTIPETPAAQQDATAQDAAKTVTVKPAATDQSLALSTIAFTKGGNVSHGSYLKNAWQKIHNRYFWHDGSGKLQTGWVITTKNFANNKETATQRYWVDSAKGLLFNQFVEYSKGKFAYATDKGYVARGKLKTKNGMLIANNDGSLLENTHSAGWLVTKEYDGGMQRYYIYKANNGHLYAKVGKFSVDKKNYYGIVDQGYVARGVYVISNYITHPSNYDDGTAHTDTILVANDEGVLQDRAYVATLLLKSAYSQKGCKYNESGSVYHPGESFNCSGFTWWVYSDALGINISHCQGYYSYYTHSSNKEDSQSWGVMKRKGWKTNITDLQPGDLVFFSLAGDKYRTGHVGIYVGSGKMIDAWPKLGVSIRDVSSCKGFVGGGFPITLVS